MSVVRREENAEEALLTRSASSEKIPKDSFHFAYIVYFTLGAGFLLPWNAFITAVDYFSYLYPETNVDRLFAVVYMLVGLVCLLIILPYAHKSNSSFRINLGLILFMVSILLVPVLDVVYIKGRTGLYSGFYVTIGAVGLFGVADALVQGSVVGSAGELPERYMQAVFAGTAASGQNFHVGWLKMKLTWQIFANLVHVVAWSLLSLLKTPNGHATQGRDRC